MSNDARKIVVYQDHAGLFRWHAVAGDGTVVHQGEEHGRLSGARRAARAKFPGLPVEVMPDDLGPDYERQAETGEA